jgi:hypothetical protein
MNHVRNARTRHPYRASLLLAAIMVFASFVSAGTSKQYKIHGTCESRARSKSRAGLCLQETTRFAKCRCAECRHRVRAPLLE